MTAIPSQSYLDSARNEGALKGGIFNPILACLTESIGGAPITELTIASGVITPTAAFHSVDTESSTPSDTLDTVEVTNHPEGRIVVLRCGDAGRAITLKHAAGGTGQMLLRGDADIVLDNLDDFVWLQRVGTSWVEVLRSGPQTATLIDGMTAAAARTTLNAEEADDTILKEDNIATQAQAEAGTSNDVVMTALRVAQAIAALAEGGKTRLVREFFDESSGSWTAPVANARVTLVGKGGDGANGAGTTIGGGGGGGGYSEKDYTDFVVGESYSFTINDSSTSFRGMTANAGGDGTAQDMPSNGGLGGTANGGDINIAGTRAGMTNGTSTPKYSGAGGSAGGRWGGKGGESSSSSYSGQNGQDYGGGGGGAIGSTPGTGGKALVLFEYMLPVS